MKIYNTTIYQQCNKPVNITREDDLPLLPLLQFDLPLRNPTNLLLVGTLRVNTHHQCGSFKGIVYKHTVTLQADYTDPSTDYTKIVVVEFEDTRSISKKDLIPLLKRLALDKLWYTPTAFRYDIPDGDAFDPNFQDWPWVINKNESSLESTNKTDNTPPHFTPSSTDHVKKPLKIEIGKFYRTRNGNCVYIDDIDLSRGYPISGTVKDPLLQQWVFDLWTLNGSYLQYKETPLDIVGPWVEGQVVEDNISDPLVFLLKDLPGNHLSKSVCRPSLQHYYKTWEGRGIGGIIQTFEGTYLIIFKDFSGKLVVPYYTTIAMDKPTSYVDLENRLLEEAAKIGWIDNNY